MNTPFLTIGYGNRSFSGFVALLRTYGVRALVDVRSQPGSGYNPDFTRNRLSLLIEREGIQYVFMGDQLGGRPPDQTCYRDGCVDYAKVEARPPFRAGIERLREDYGDGLRMCLMCSELRPERCHRTRLIGTTLSQTGISVRHIDETGRLITQQQAIDRITGGQLTLFEDSFA